MCVCAGVGDRLCETLGAEEGAEREVPRSLSQYSADPVQAAKVFLYLCTSHSYCRVHHVLFSTHDCHVGLVVRRPPRERKVPGLNTACTGIFSGLSHTCDLNIGTPVATLPGAWRYRVSAGSGEFGVSIL